LRKKDSRALEFLRREEDIYCRIPSANEQKLQHMWLFITKLITVLNSLRTAQGYLETPGYPWYKSRRHEVGGLSPPKQSSKTPKLKYETL